MQGNTLRHISGNVSVVLSAPYLPFDRYDRFGNDTGPDGTIDDPDLLFAIDSWVLDRQFSGIGGKWPADIVNGYNGIILAVINIWANQSNAGYYAPGPAGTNAGQQVMDVQTKPGEYQFIGDRDTDETLDIYAPGNGEDGYPEMYWTHGEW